MKLKQCEFCGVEKELLSHLEESTPEEPKYCCCKCRNDIGIYLMDFHFTIKQGNDTLKLFHKHNRRFYKYIIFMRKLSKITKESINSIIKEIRQKEQTISVNRFNCYREVMLQDYEKHNIIMFWIMEDYIEEYPELLHINNSSVNTNNEYVYINYYK